MHSITLSGLGLPSEKQSGLESWQEYVFCLFFFLYAMDLSPEHPLFWQMPRLSSRSFIITTALLKFPSMYNTHLKQLGTFIVLAPFCAFVFEWLNIQSLWISAHSCLCLVVVPRAICMLMPPGTDYTSCDTRKHFNMHPDFFYTHLDVVLQVLKETGDQNVVFQAEVLEHQIIWQNGCVFLSVKAYIPPLVVT